MPRFDDDDDYEPQGISGAKMFGAFVVFCFIVLIIGLGVYFGVYYETEEQKKKRLEAERIAAEKKRLAEEAAKKSAAEKEVADRLAKMNTIKAADPSCNYQPTKAYGQVICPVGFDTKYNYGVNVAAACSTEAAPCDRCIGKAYPDTWLKEDPTIKWDHPIAIGPVDSGNRVMSYSGTYVAEPRPIPTVAGKKCYV